MTRTPDPATTDRPPTSGALHPTLAQLRSERHQPNADDRRGPPRPTEGPGREQISGRAGTANPRVLAADLVRGQAQRGLGDRVDQRAALLVVVQRVGDAFELGAADGDEVGGRGGIEEAPDRERDPHVVHHRAPGRRSTLAAVRSPRTREGVVDRLTVLAADLPTDALGERDGVTLVGALVAEAGAARLAAVDLRRAIARHASGTWSGDSYPRARSSGVTGANLGAAISRSWQPSPDGGEDRLQVGALGERDRVVERVPGAVETSSDRPATRGPVRPRS